MITGKKRSRKGCYGRSCGYTCMNCGDERRGKPVHKSASGEPRCGDCFPEKFSVKIPVSPGGATVDLSARTLPKLREIAMNWVESNDYGTSDVGSQWLVSGDKRVHCMSYNGKYWDRSGNEV